jgi:hypothetical protein
MEIEKDRESKPQLGIKRERIEMVSEQRGASPKG